jgi:hypothetical protein
VTQDTAAKQTADLAPTPLTRHEIVIRWPSPVTRPTPNTLWRWLCRACDLGVLVHHGSGSKTDAFRDGVAASETQIV